MKKHLLLLCALALFFAVGCGADKNSNEACLYDATMNLDKENYDAVLASSCANYMHKGAAYFGKAGYSAKDVINRFSEAKSTTNDLSTYMNALTGKVTEDTLNNIDLAKSNYCAYIGGTVDLFTGQCINVNQGIPNYQDAQFYISLVDAVKSVSLIKIVADSTGLGTLSTDCDKNANGVPDDADATACAFYLSSGQPNCTSLDGSGTVNVNTDASDISITNKSGTYRGLVIQIAGAGTATSCSNTNNEYKKLLFLQTTIWAPATTTSEMCQESFPDNTRQWPCPIEQGGAPLDLVTAIDQSITSAISSMGQALPAGTAADVQQSITDIKTQACPTGTCTSSDLANYLQTF